MTVLSRHMFIASAFLVATFGYQLSAQAAGKEKFSASSYWRGGYFGPAFSLTKLKNTYNPAVPVGVKKLRAGGKLIGMIGGYNFLEKDYMWGMEADMANGGVFSDNLSYLSTLRGRIGKPVKYSLPFITGGLAIAGLKKQSAGAPYKTSRTQFGFVIGAGIEQVLANAITGRLEYSYGRFISNGRTSGPRVRIKQINMFRASIVIHLKD